MFSCAQDVRPGLPRWGYALLLAALIGLFAVGPAVACAPAGRLAESEAPAEEEEVDGQESASLPSAPRSVRPPSAIPAPLRPHSDGRHCLASILGSPGRPLAVSGLPPALPLRC